MKPEYNEVQLDALRELANIASGTAATALSQMLGREVDLSVPQARALSMADAVDACGAPDDDVSGIVIPLEGDIAGVVLLMIPPEDSGRLCRLLGVEPGSEVGDSALCEIGNILGTSYLTALASMTGLTLMPCPPHLAVDMLGAIVASLLIEISGAEDLALVLDSALRVADEDCSISFLLLPSAGGVTDLLTPLGVAEAA